MSKKKASAEPPKEAGTIEQLVMRLIREKEKFRDRLRPEGDFSDVVFQRIQGQIDILYIVLTASGNPQANPKIV